MKRTRWKMHEVFKAVGIAEHYQRARYNAKYAREWLDNEGEALKWDKVAEDCIRDWEEMGLGEIVSGIKRIL